VTRRNPCAYCVLNRRTRIRSEFVLPGAESDREPAPKRRVVGVDPRCYNQQERGCGLGACYYSRARATGSRLLGWGGLCRDESIREGSGRDSVAWGGVE